MLVRDYNRMADTPEDSEDDYVCHLCSNYEPSLVHMPAGERPVSAAEAATMALLDERERDMEQGRETEPESEGDDICTKTVHCAAWREDGACPSAVEVDVDSTEEYFCDPCRRRLLEGINAE
ncbi:hypothetical protein KIPB_016531, partial [Kipferlia bialata]|eukprot:g16531.t1